MKRFPRVVTAAFALLVCACTPDAKNADSGADTTQSAQASAAAPTSPFAGTYAGSWAGVTDTTDVGTTELTVDASGAITGTDHDTSEKTTDRLSGQINADGTVTINTAPEDGSAGATLKGTLKSDGPNRVSGVLLWTGQPPTSYNYTLTRSN